MANKISFFNKYINKELAEYLSDNSDRNIVSILEYIKEEFNPNEVIPTIINLININIESKKLILYLDLINYYISVVSYDKIKYFKELIFEKFVSLLYGITLSENRSIIYQFLIDYSALYDVNIKVLKSKFPIDREMFLKKVVELATEKTYLRFMLMYEVSIFFEKGELDYLWPEINAFGEAEKTLFFNVFINSFNEKNLKKIFRFIASSPKVIQLKFVATLNFYFKEKKLYFKNILSLTEEEFDKILPHKPRNGFFSQSFMYFSPERQRFLLLMNFFEYKKYTLVFESDFNLSLKQAKLIKQPILFNGNFFKNNYRNDFPYMLKINSHFSEKLYKGILFKTGIKNLPAIVSLVNYFTFSNTLMPEEYDFLINKKKIFNKIHLNKEILRLIIDNNFHTFLEFDKFITVKVSHKKDNIKAFLSSPVFRKNFDDYINENKADILKSLAFIIELAKFVSGKKELIHFLVSVYMDINEKNGKYFEIEYISHLLLFYISTQKNE